MSTKNDRPHAVERKMEKQITTKVNSFRDFSSGYRQQNGSPSIFTGLEERRTERYGILLTRIIFSVGFGIVEYLCLVYGRSGQHHSFTKIAPKDSVPHVNRRHIQNGFLKGPKTYSVLCKYIPKLTYLKKGYYNIGIEVKEIFAVVK